MSVALTAGDLHLLEHLVTRAPLAIRVTDLATGRPVRNGISITAWPAGLPARPELARTTLDITGSGIGGFQNLPGLRSYEDGSTAPTQWFASPLLHGPVPFAIRVDDATGEHLRAMREVIAPSATVIDVALPRSPSAPTPSGWLTATATIVTETGTPAAWAVLELSVAGVYTTGGVADERGVVVIPVPRAVPATRLDPPAKEPSWLLTVRVRYQPDDQAQVPGSRADDPPTVNSLLAQSPAIVNDGGVFAASLDRSIAISGPLVIASSVAPATSLVLVVRPVP